MKEKVSPLRAKQEAALDGYYDHRKSCSECKACQNCMCPEGRRLEQEFVDADNALKEAENEA